MTGLRIGHGYDVHRLTEGRRLILGGVEVPYEKGLLGHSDADVLTHAVMDALLGAAALGQYKPYFDQDDVEVLFVVNAFRPLSGDADSVCDLMLRVAGRSRLSPTAVINNANVAWETEESDLVRGEELLREVSTRMNLPIGYLCAKQDILDKLPDHLSGERIAIDILMRPEWME